MGALSALFNKDVILDQAAFAAAAKQFEELSLRLQKLDEEIEDMLEILQSGFDTPAGRTFVESCRENLNQPMKDQKVVLEHISQTLADVMQIYSGVFTKYEELNRTVNSYSHKP